jgi:hypothetical protein
VFPTKQAKAIPDKQLKLVHDELNRARTAATARLASFHTRGALLVTASGLFTALQVSKQVNCLSIIATVLFLAAAVIGLVVLRPVSGHEVDPSTVRPQWIEMTPYDTEVAIIEANEYVLTSDREVGDSLSRLILVGYIALVAAWTAAYVSQLLPLSY